LVNVLDLSIEAMAEEERRELQGRRLTQLVQRLSTLDTPYWRKKLDGIAQVNGLDDLERLPLTTKAELRDTYPFGMLAVPLADTIRLHASSGTRGKPTVVAYTPRDVELFAEVNARSIACAGGRPDDVLHVAYGYGLFTGGLGLHYGGERLGATVVPASGGNAALQVELMADLGATGLACTPSFALLLAETARERGLRSRIRLRYGIFGAEPWSEAMRAKLEAAWGIDACDIYGLSEVIGPGVAVECPEGSVARAPLPNRRRDALRRRALPMRAQLSSHRALLGPHRRHADRARSQRLPQRDRGRRARRSGARGPVRDRRRPARAASRARAARRARPGGEPR
jgi:phenylacetate-CoA ligase